MSSATLYDYLSREPAWLAYFYGSEAVVLVSSAIGELSATNTEAYSSTAENLSIPWVAEELDFIEREPENYPLPLYFELFAVLPITTIMLILQWLSEYSRETYEAIDAQLQDPQSNIVSVLKQRLRSAARDISINEIVNDGTAELIKEALA